MNSLPVETIVLIFKFLHLRQKLECTLVCRRWAQILRDDCLFETIEVSVSSSFKHFNGRITQLIEDAKSGSFPGRSCKRLLIANDSNSDINFNGVDLAKSFPNLRSLYIKNGTVFKPDIRKISYTDDEPDLFYSWRNSLKTLVAGNFEGSFLLNALETGIFSRLTTLIVTNSSLQSNQLDSKFVSNLKNTPSLTTLAINSSKLSIFDLEELHKNVIRLISLTLVGELQLHNADMEPFQIVPAINLKILKMVDFCDHELNLDALLRYAKAKYINICEFFYSENIYFGSSHLRAGHSLFSKYAWAEFIASTGSLLKKCTINPKYQLTEVVDLLEKHTFQLEQLNMDVFKKEILLKNVLSGQAFQGLRSLSLRRLPLTFKLTDFKKLTNLKELTLDFSLNSTILWAPCFQPIQISHIVNDLPNSIQRLCLKDTSITIGEEPTIGDSNLIHLEFSKSLIEENVSVILSQSFPFLKSLVLELCRLNSPLELPNHHLNYFEFTLPQEYIRYRKYTETYVRDMELEITHLKMTVSDKVLYYKTPVIEGNALYPQHKQRIDHRDRSVQQVLKATKYDEKLNYFHFKCASIKTVYFFDYLLLLP